MGEQVHEEPHAQKKSSHHNRRSWGPPSNSCTDVSTHVSRPAKNDALIAGPCSFQGRRVTGCRLLLSAAAPRTNSHHTLPVVHSRSAPGKQALGRKGGSLQGFGWRLRAKPRGEGHTSARRREGGQGGHLFFWGGELLLPSTLRRASPTRHLGIRPPAEGRPLLRVGGEVGKRRRPMLPVLTTAGLRLLARSDFTGDA